MSTLSKKRRAELHEILSNMLCLEEPSDVLRILPTSMLKDASVFLEEEIAKRYRG